MDFYERLPDAVPVPCAGDDLDVSGASSIPRYHEAGARDCVRYDFLGGSQLVAFHARASPGLARARWRGLIEGGIAIKLADQGEVLAVFAAKPCGLAGALAAVAHEDKVALRKPAHPARQQPPGEVRGRLMTRAMHTLPLRGTGPRLPRRGVPRAERRMAT